MRGLAKVLGGPISRSAELRTALGRPATRAGVCIATIDYQDSGNRRSSSVLQCRLKQIQQRSYHDYVRGFTPEGATYKVPLSSEKVVGIAQSRGWRPHQEDRTAVATLQLNPQELQLTLELNHRVDWQPTAGKASASEGAKNKEKGTTDVMDEANRQVGYFAIFDGHGGSQISEYLHNELHGMIEKVDRSQIPDTVAFTKGLGGYFRRFRGGALQKWMEKPELRDNMTIEERATLAFLQADKHILTNEDSKRTGSTASVALLHSLDSPSQPYFAAKKLSLVTAHCGDTRILLCASATGKVELLTEKHHAEARVESQRLRRLGAGLITDSFGESRWMGAIENTRSLGDGDFKPSGVTAEPEVKHRLLDGPAYSYMVLVTDGVSTMISNQEIVDLIRESPDPTQAAQTIVDFADDLGAEDNCTCMVVPLAGWGKVGGKDETKERRDYRRRKAGEQNSQMERSLRM